MRLASSYLVLASSFKDLQAAEDAFFISNQRLTFDQAKLFCSEDGYLAEGTERNINNLVSGKSLWINGEKVLNDLRNQYKKKNLDFSIFGYFRPKLGGQARLCLTRTSQFNRLDPTLVKFRHFSLKVGDCRSVRS